ncbi:MAG: 50S ribosomal protein L28 [Tagaea sp. CACIAM 22H2]|jgi:large subunit ribosomal protein L28|nr:50S ribosomal protein L28 [Tagaea sp. CACIAM 22H2]
MSRRCIVTGKGALVGNNVSHANNKTKRRFLPNLQAATLLSDVLGQGIRVRLTTRGLKTVEHAGGLDAWLSKTPAAKLDKDLRRFKARIEKALEKRAA